MAITYLNNDGSPWLTRDYNMDQGDLANLKASGGTSMLSDPFAGQRAYNEQANQITNANLPTAYAQQDAIRQQAATANVPLLDTSTPEALAKSQMARAAATPGGADFFRRFTGSGNFDSNGNITPLSPIVTSQPGAASDPRSFLSEPLTSGNKALPGQRLPTDLLSDSRFRSLYQQNPTGAKNFYRAVVGRDYDTDLAAQAASIASQTTAQTELAKSLASSIGVASKDNGDLGIKKGDYIKRQVVPSLMPGQSTYSELPLNDSEMELAGLHRDVNGQMIRSNGPSKIRQLIGLDAPADVDTGIARQLALEAKARQPAPGAPRTRPFASAVPVTSQLTANQQQGTIDRAGATGALQGFGNLANSASNLGRNVVTSGLNGINRVSNFFGGGDITGAGSYETPQQTAQRLALQANQNIYGSDSAF